MATSRKSFKDVFDKYKYDREAVKRSRSWFQGQLALLRAERIQPATLMRADQTALRPRIMPGFLYMFVYDPKTKAKLPYYDTFPLVFPFAKTPNGFLGLNMHYLPYQLRVLLLERLTVRPEGVCDGALVLKYAFLGGHLCKCLGGVIHTLLLQIVLLGGVHDGIHFYHKT